VALRAIHDFELALLDVCLAMSHRGVLIDEPRRKQMMADLDDMRGPLIVKAAEIVLPKLESAKRLPKRHLFRDKWVCPCCRGGKVKSQACWSCAGFSALPTAKELVYKRVWEKGTPVAAMRAQFLKPCLVCNGDGKRETWTFNPGSDDQVKVVLYDVLKLPKRTKDGKLRSDEEALKDLRPHDDTGLIDALLKITKSTTMRSILERIAPGDDGINRSFYNPAGTENGRFSSAGSFLMPSTNHQNITKREAAGEPRYDVRRCFVPGVGFSFVEGDLSGAEAWPSAALANDLGLLRKLEEGTDIHRWTASRIFGKRIDEITWAERQLGKMARHALNYGMQWATFQRNVNAQSDRTEVSVAAVEAKRICAGYHELHPRLQEWWKTVAQKLQHDKQMTTCFGRTRTFFGRGAYTWLSDTHREAIAFEPQSTVADLLNRGLLRWWRQHDSKIGEVRMQVHDSVVLVVPNAKVKLAARLLQRCLTEEVTVNGITFTIPVDVSVSGENWASMEAA